MTEGHKKIQKRKKGRKSTNIIWVTQLNEKIGPCDNTNKRIAMGYNDWARLTG